MMIRRTTVLFLAGVILIIAGSRTFAYTHTNITAEQAHQLIESADDLIIVDVREKSEFCGATGHIPGALNYPWNSGVLQARYEELPVDSPILVVCRSGGRSNNAANFLDSKGFSMVYDMLGGMNAWQWETALCKYTGGSGTVSDPYQIATAEDLILLGESPEDYDKHFKLMADIDLSGYVYDRAVIAPDTDPCDLSFMGLSFMGVFDGNGRTVSNMTITGTNYLGLFGRVESAAQIKNLGVVDVNITGSDYLGGLVGFSRGSIATSYCTGSINGDRFLGGLTGRNWLNITECHSTATVTGSDDVGGLAGGNYSGITDSYSTGAVTANWDAGGLVGANSGNISTSYSTAIVIGENRAGGLVGYNWSDDSVTSSFWDVNTSGQTASAGGSGKTTAEMMDPNTFISAGWDFNDVWVIWDGYDYPRLAWEPGPNTPLVFVDINDPNFYGQMSKYEVTNDQYCDFLNTALTSGDITINDTIVEGAIGLNSGEDYIGERYYRCDGSGYTGYGATNGGASRIHYSEGTFSVDNGFGNHPVTYVSWYGAMAFSNYYGYYLPTEGQWQAVADYDGTFIYGCGETIDPGIANYRDLEHPDGTACVGSFGQCGYGMNDMAGNVWEWTSSESESSRIFRGGGWYSYDSDCAVSIRGDGIPYANYSDIGFRVCR